MIQHDVAIILESCIDIKKCITFVQVGRGNKNIDLCFYISATGRLKYFKMLKVSNKIWCFCFKFQNQFLSLMSANQQVINSQSIFDSLDINIHVSAYKAEIVIPKKVLLWDIMLAPYCPYKTRKIHAFWNMSVPKGLRQGIIHSNNLSDHLLKSKGYLQGLLALHLIKLITLVSDTWGKNWGKSGEF